MSLNLLKSLLVLIFLISATAWSQGTKELGQRCDSSLGLAGNCKAPYGCYASSPSLLAPGEEGYTAGEQDSGDEGGEQPAGYTTPKAAGEECSNSAECQSRICHGNGDSNNPKNLCYDEPLYLCRQPKNGEMTLGASGQIKCGTNLNINPVDNKCTYDPAVPPGGALQNCGNEKCDVVLKWMKAMEYLVNNPGATYIKGSKSLDCLGIIHASKELFKEYRNTKVEALRTFYKTFNNDVIAKMKELAERDKNSNNTQSDSVGNEMRELQIKMEQAYIDYFMKVNANLIHVRDQMNEIRDRYNNKDKQAGKYKNMAGQEFSNHIKSDGQCRRNFVGSAQNDFEDFWASRYRTKHGNNYNPDGSFYVDMILPPNFPDSDFQDFGNSAAFSGAHRRAMFRHSDFWESLGSIFAAVFTFGLSELDNMVTAWNNGNYGNSLGIGAVSIFQTASGDDRVLHMRETHRMPLVHFLLDIKYLSAVAKYIEAGKVTRNTAYSLVKDTLLHAQVAEHIEKIKAGQVVLDAATDQMLLSSNYDGMIYMEDIGKKKDEQDAVLEVTNLIYHKFSESDNDEHPVSRRSEFFQDFEHFAGALVDGITSVIEEKQKRIKALDDINKRKFEANGDLAVGPGNYDPKAIEEGRARAKKDPKLGNVKGINKDAFNGKLPTIGASSTNLSGGNSTSSISSDKAASANAALLQMHNAAMAANKKYKEKVDAFRNDPKNKVYVDRADNKFKASLKQYAKAAAPIKANGGFIGSTLMAAMGDKLPEPKKDETKNSGPVMPDFASLMNSSMPPVVMPSMPSSSSASSTTSTEPAANEEEDHSAMVNALNKQELSTQEGDGLFDIVSKTYKRNYGKVLIKKKANAPVNDFQIVTPKKLKAAPQAQ